MVGAHAGAFHARPRATNEAGLATEELAGLLATGWTRILAYKIELSAAVLTIGSTPRKERAVDGTLVGVADPQLFL